MDLSRNFGSYESPVVWAAAALAIPKIGDMPDPCKSSCFGEPRLDVRRQIDRNSAHKTPLTTSCIRSHSIPPQPYLQVFDITKGFSPLNGRDGVCAIEGSMISCLILVATRIEVRSKSPPMQVTEMP